MPSRRDFPEVLQGLADRLAAEFKDSGVAAELAVSMAGLAVNVIRQDWGGHTIYIPTGYAFERQATHREMYRKWRAGTKPKALAAEYSMTLPAVYVTLRRLRKEHAHDGNQASANPARR